MSQAAEGAGATKRARPVSIVAEGVLFRGDIEGSTDLHVEGRVIGKIAVNDLVVGAESSIHGPVTADAATIGGRVTGPVKAKSVHLLSTARLEGDLSCTNIRMDDGACLTGRCDAEDKTNVVRMFQSSDGGGGRLIDAGQELLDIAARLRGI